MPSAPAGAHATSPPREARRRRGASRRATTSAIPRRCPAARSRPGAGPCRLRQPRRPTIPGYAPRRLCAPATRYCGRRRRRAICRRETKPAGRSRRASADRPGSRAAPSDCEAAASRDRESRCSPCRFRVLKRTQVTSHSARARLDHRPPRCQSSAPRRYHPDEHDRYPLGRRRCAPK